MKQSQLFHKTLKETPSDADSVNASYLVRADFVQKHMAGAYAFMPLGFKVIKKIEKIVQEEMDAIGGQQILMNIMQPKGLWEKTDRWESMDEVLYKSGDEKNQIAFAATHEEQVTSIVKNHIKSYKDLPLALYQIQTKFRNEPRAKSGLLRGREFLMKDMYSFHTTEKDFEEFYEKSKIAYLKIFKRLGLKAKIVEASGGTFTEKHSHEFQVLTEVGEDVIFFCDKCNFSVNKEISEVEEGNRCPKCEGKIKKANGIEVGNIFPLEKKYSHALEAKYVDKDGKEQEMIMGCYGIGISRSLATIVEMFYNQTENKMVWPEAVSPFKFHILSLNQNKKAEELYKTLKENTEVLYDDRETSAGTKFAEADLIGCPTRIIISEKSLASGGVEVIDILSNTTKIIKLETITQELDVK
jgi:prolyl-tRNA synthetase